MGAATSAVVIMAAAHATMNSSSYSGGGLPPEKPKSRLYRILITSLIVIGIVTAIAFVIWIVAPCFTSM